VAIYHLEGKVISRSAGRSSVAAAAYRSCEKLLDDRTGLTHDFTKKSPDLVESEIMLPKNASSKLADRQYLWNLVEQTEKRKDAQLCREFNIALPRELSDAQNWDLAKSFVQKEFVDLGMIADVAFHRGHKSQEGQPHIHVMLTMREVNGDEFGQKVRSWNDKALLQQWREAWANECNQVFARQGLDIRIDHRTLEAQGIDLEPQTKIGAKDAQGRLAKMIEHQEKARANGERILEDPNIVLDAITKHQSTFTQRDIAKFVHRYTADREQFDQVMPKVMAHPELVLLGRDDQGRDRYSTYEMIETEKRLVTDALELASCTKHAVSPLTIQDVAVKAGLKDQYLEAFNYLMADSDMRNLVGVAGSGKSTLLDAVREAHERQGHRVIGMTLAGKAAEGLEESSGIKSRTVASHIASWDNGFDQLTNNDVIVIDEAAMLDSRQYERILSEAKNSGAKVISAFDVEQLQAIGAGAPARAVAERTGYCELSIVRRQQVEWQREASQHFAMGETEKGLLSYEQHDCVHAYNTKEAAVQGMLERWEELRSEQPDKTQLMVAYENKDVKQLNEAARTLRKAADELKYDRTVQTERGKREFSEGDRVYFLRNDYRELDVRNGTLGTIERIDGDRMDIRVDATDRKPERTVTIDTKSYNHLDYGYAATAHKSQGATVDYTQYMPSPYADRHATYSGMTRHREGAEIHYSRDTFPDFQAAAKSMSRENTKDFTLDYIEVRGLEPKDEFKLKREVVYTQEDRIGERMAEAEKRMAHRQFYNEAKRPVGNMGLELSKDELKVGDKGIYRGMVQVEDRRYGVLDMGHGQAKLVPREMMESRHQGKAMEVEQKIDRQGKEQLRGVQAYDRQRERERRHDRDRGISF